MGRKDREYREFEEPGDELRDEEYPDGADEFDEEESDVFVCPNCGADVYEDSPQCPRCGEWLDADQGEGTVSDEGALWVVMLGFILFVGAAVLVGWLLM